jgi:hypothetical protein
MSKQIPRRTVLRGTLQAGLAVTVGLPIFDRFLNGNGTAYATGAAFPLRFGSWHWGCGMNPARWNPKKTGANYELSPELQAIAPYKQHINVISGGKIYLDDALHEPHFTGIWALRTGSVPNWAGEKELPSFDVVIADAVGQQARFRSLDIAADGNKKNSLSRRNAATINTAEGSALDLYMRVFGDGFQDPNNATFTPDAKTMLRKGAVSAVLEDSRRLSRELGASDRARLDEYFTSLRQLENQLALQLEPPAKAEACVVPQAPGAATVANTSGPTGTFAGWDVEDVTRNHHLMAEILGMALLCNQTLAFNVMFSASGSGLRRVGLADTHHTYTHNERIDETLGYQPNATWFSQRSMEAWADFVRVMASYKEGDGLLLDHMLVQAHSDTSFAHVHALENIPLMTAGKANGRVRTGIHVALNGDPVTRVMLTDLQAMGLSTSRFGHGSMETTKAISEILA